MMSGRNQQTAAHYEDDVREKLCSLKWAPIVYSTAITGHSVDNIVVAAAIVQKERSRRLSTVILNQVIREAVAFKSPPRTRGSNKATDVCVLCKRCKAVFGYVHKIWRSSYILMQALLGLQLGFFGAVVKDLTKMEEVEEQ